MTSWHIKTPNSWVVVPFLPALFSVCVRVVFVLGENSLDCSVDINVIDNNNNSNTITIMIMIMLRNNDDNDDFFIVYLVSSYFL